MQERNSDILFHFYVECHLIPFAKVVFIRAGQSITFEHFSVEPEKGREKGLGVNLVV